MNQNRGLKLMKAQQRGGGFSLVEVLTAAVLLGILSFIAVPNIVRMKSDSEMNLAIARAEAVNMAVASYVQSYGRATANTEWQKADTQAKKYALLTAYLAFAPTKMDDYMPTGYTIKLPSSVSTLEKAKLTDVEDNVVVY